MAQLLLESSEHCWCYQLMKNSLMMKEPVGFVGGEAGMSDYSNFVCHNQLLSDDVVESVK